MPLTPKGRKIEENMEKEYGPEKGKHVFYASKNKGTISGVEGKKKHVANKMKAALKTYEHHKKHGYYKPTEHKTFGGQTLIY